MQSSERFALGVDLGGTSIKLGVVSENGKIANKHTVETKAIDGPLVVIDQIKKGIKEIIEKTDKHIYGIGIGAPGVVSAKKGFVENPPNFPGWEKVNLKKVISDEFGINAFIENDANAAAIGEMIFGEGKNYKSFIMVTLGTGVGGGIIHKRKIFRGEFGAAGEIGHISIDRKGPKCNCGSHGCIETYIGNNYLVKWVKAELFQNKNSRIWQLINAEPDNLTPKIIQDAAEAGDEYAHAIIKRMGEYLGTAMASLANVLDISTFIFGGGVAGFGTPLFESIHKTIVERVLIPLRVRIRVLPAHLKNDAGIQGAGALVFYKS